MIAQQRRQETISNNIANINTPGYKADSAPLRSFPEMLVQLMDSNKVPTTNELKLPYNRQIGGLTTGVYAQETIPNFIQGMLRETELYTDIALVDRTIPDETGTFLFTVENADGAIRYTRNGNFTVDGEGFLTTNEGFYVLDNAGNPIQTNSVEFTVTPEGVVQTEDAAAQLGIVYIPNATELVKEENDLYNPDVGDVAVQDPAAAGAVFRTQQHFLEGSNVNPAQSMTEMMQAYRIFELNQTVLKAYDDSMGRAVNDIARLG